MAKRKNIFENMNLSDAAYLLDPSLKTDEMTEVKLQKEVKKVIKSADKMDIQRLHTFENHPYTVDESADDFKQLMESIQDNGVVEPLLVRPIAGGEQYEIISGHRRCKAAELLGLQEVPVIIREMDDDTATILMVHSNFYREKIKVSEKARAYRMCMDAEKHQGKKGGNTASSVGKDQDSSRQVYRYVRLSYLIEPFFSYLDDGVLAVNAGSEISYLDETSQKAVYDCMKDLDKKISIDQATSIRNAFNDKKELSYQDVYEILNPTSNVEKKVAVKVTLNEKKLFEYFPPEMSVSSMEEIIFDLLQGYKEGTIVLHEGEMVSE